MPSNSQAITSPKVQEEIGKLRQGYLDKFESRPPFEGENAYREYAAFLRTQTAGASNERWLAIEKEMPKGYSLTIPSERQRVAVDNVTDSLTQRYGITEEEEIEKARIFANEAVARLKLTGKPAAEIEKAVDSIASERELIGAKPGAMRLALDRVVERQFIEAQDPAQREQVLMTTSGLLRQSRPGSEREHLAVTHRLLVDSLSDRAQSEAANKLGIPKETVVDRFNESANTHETTGRGPQFDDAVKARVYAVREAKQEIIGVGVSPASAEVIGDLANREWLKEREQILDAQMSNKTRGGMIADLDNYRNQIRRAGAVGSAEDKMAERFSQQLRNGRRDIDLSVTYATGNQSIASERHAEALGKLQPMIDFAKHNGYNVRAGQAHTADVAAEQARVFDKPQRLMELHA